MKKIVGLDFDNTIINYDDVFYKEAITLGLITSKVSRNKKIIRDTIRQLPDGENKWQQLQVQVYAVAISDARLNDGVAQFIAQCLKNDIALYVVSHKTEIAYLGKKPLNLRKAALSWMEQKQFFDKKGLNLSPASVFFESTREEKISRLTNLNCTHFIDDLEETFLENSFPKNVEKVLFTQKPSKEISIPSVKIFDSWEKIHEYFFASAKR